MKIFRLGIAVTTMGFLLFGCSSSRLARRTASWPSFLIEGHRGTRGHMPENTIPAMKEGIRLGANVVELDVYTTADGEVLVAHDPRVNINHSLRNDGSEISKAEAADMIWHKMNYAEIRKLDVGSKYYAAFPRQQKIKTYMPLLDELMDSVETFTRQAGLAPVRYNIELKTSPAYDKAGYNAAPQDLADAVMQVVNRHQLHGRFLIQSFDMRPLQYIHRKYPAVAIGFLTSDKRQSLDQNLQQLGFSPDFYSPEYKLVNAEMVSACHRQHMKLVPWTVNDPQAIAQLKSWGVDGIITDYPDLLTTADK